MPDIISENKDIDDIRGGYGGYKVYSLIDSNRYSAECEAVINGMGEEEILYIKKKLEEQKTNQTSPGELSEEPAVQARADKLARFLRR